jgi:hypothetical protein
LSEQELKELLAAMERVRAVHMATPEKARQFLMEGGLITENGELAEPYRPAA